MRIMRQIGSLAFVLGLFVVFFIGLPWHVITADDPAIPWWLQSAVFCMLGGILVVLISVALEQRHSGPTGTDVPAVTPHDDILLSSADHVPGHDIVSHLGLAQGHTVYAIWLGKDLSAIIRLILGGELTEYTDMMGRARNAATGRMVAQAEQMGADAIINIRYMTTSVVGSAAELLVYGTAVKFG